MSKFVFNLEGVLRQRKTVEQMRQRELAEVLSIYTQAEAELRTLDANVLQICEDVRLNRLTGRLDLTFLAGHRRYIAAMQRKALAIATRMAEIKVKVDQARLALGLAARERKVMEKLREKQFEAWREEQSRKESADLDEARMQLSYENLMTEDKARAKACRLLHQPEELT